MYICPHPRKLELHDILPGIKPLKNKQQKWRSNYMSKYQNKSEYIAIALLVSIIFLLSRRLHCWLLS